MKLHVQVIKGKKTQEEVVKLKKIFFVNNYYVSQKIHGGGKEPQNNPTQNLNSEDCSLPLVYPTKFQSR